MEYNTDGNKNLNINEQAYAILGQIAEWIEKYTAARKDIRGDRLLKGTINVYVDSADIGFRQLLEICARDVRLSNGLLLSSFLRFFGATKTAIWDRVQFERIMFGFGDFKIVSNCKNLIREIKNSRRGEKGEARVDGNDHQINASEYAWAPFRNMSARWKMINKDSSD